VLPERAVGWVTEAMGPGSRLVTARRQGLGGWHVNHAVDVADRQGRVHRLMLRRWARPDWAVQDADYTVEREVRVLGLLAGTPVPVPSVLAADPDGTACDVPAILQTRLRGHAPGPADFGAGDFYAQLAQVLAAIHQAGPAAVRLEPYRLYYDRAAAVPARWMTGETWRRAVGIVAAQPPPAAMTLIHRDYHPENTLWSRGRLTGVVDWTQASSGPPQLDLAHMRWNLAADHGQQAADLFAACYRSAAGAELPAQPYWDLVSLMDLLLDIGDPGDLGPDMLGRLEDYAATALRSL
jgi:aminoglycoside phosphotransferase (APT) family kinase protein